MSDAPQGDGWWQASDGKWYPPAQHPNAAADPAPTQQTPAKPPGQPPGGQPTGVQPPPFPAAQQAGAQPPPFQTPGAQPPGTQAPGMPPSGTTGDEDDQEPEKKSKKGLIIALIVLLLLIAAAVAGVLLFGGSDDDDENKSAPTTTAQTDIGDATGERLVDGPIEFNKDYDDSLEGTRTEARYSLDAPDGAIMTLTVANEAGSESGVFATFESAGQQFAAFRVQPGATTSETVILTGDGGAPFELTFTEGAAAYTFQVGLEIQDDAGQGGDAGGDVKSAFEVSAGENVAGMLGGEDETDHYTVELEPGTELSMTAAVDPDADAAAFFVVELAGEQLFGERVQPGADTTFDVLLADTDEGTLEIIVTEGGAGYSFTADFVEQNDGGSPGDASAELADSRSVDPASPIEGKVGGRDAGDHFTFTAAAATLTVTASADASSESAYSVTLEDQAGATLTFFRVQPGAQAVETVEVPAGSTIRMVVAEGPATYSIQVS